MKAVILAAGLGSRLEPLTRTVPKCMVPVGGVAIIDRMIARIHEAGIDEVVVVTGHLHETLTAHVGARATCVFNPRYAEWGNFYSLMVAREAIGDASFIKLDGDVVMDGGVLPALLDAPGEVVLAIDRSEPLGDEEMKARLVGGRVVELNKRMDPKAAFGESIGIERIGAGVAPRVFDYLDKLIDRGETHEYYERAYELLIDDGLELGFADITHCTWTEIDNPADLAHAETLLRDGKV